MLNVSYQEENVDLGEAKQEWDMGGRTKRQGATEIECLAWVVWEIYFKWS